MNNCIRIKINFNDLSDQNKESRFWYLLNINQLIRIEDVANDLKKIFNEKFNYNNIDDNKYSNKQLRLYIDDYQIPYCETSTILRDNDLVTILFETNNNRKRTYNVFNLNNNNNNKIVENEEPINKKLKIDKNNCKQVTYKNPWSLTNVSFSTLINYDLCIFGTSMVKHIRIESFIDYSRGIENVFLKSISGGKIIDIYNFIRARNFLSSKYFIITCGSNDCDNIIKYDNTTTIDNNLFDDYLLLINHLKNMYSKSKIFINQLIPRLKTRYLKENFEFNRLKLNSYLEKIAKSDENLIFIKHPAFDDLEKLNSLLYDGVHIHPINGVPVYVNEIKSVFDTY